MILIRTAQNTDIPTLLDIYNYEVQYGVSTFDVQPKSLEQRKEWFEVHNVGSHPLLVADKDGVVVGYASLSKYREKEAYKSTVELSVYVAPDYRGRGVATKLMEAILQIAREDGNIHTVVSVITGGNQASVRLHEKFGFAFCGSIKEVGIKFGKYLNIENYQLMV